MDFTHLASFLPLALGRDGHEVTMPCACYKPLVCARLVPVVPEGTSLTFNYQSIK